MGDIYRCDHRGVRLVRQLRWKEQVRRSSVCRWCGCALARPTIDHIQPSSQGGANAALNAKASCTRCNAGRAAAGHCYVTFRCVEAIVGPSLSAIARFYNQSRRVA